MRQARRRRLSEISAMKRGLTSISTFAIAGTRIIGSSSGQLGRDKIFTTRDPY